MGAIDVFMDTAGFLALWDAADDHHEMAVELQAELVRKRRRFLTTDYVVDETVTLLQVRHSHRAAADFLRSVTTSALLQLQWASPDRFHAAANFFARHADKEWSFTDCVSFVLMHELRIGECFTTDHHFRQAGFNPLLGGPD
jgi:predicted nucleic acid-binding protein